MIFESKAIMIKLYITIICLASINVIGQVSLYPQNLSDFALMTYGNHFINPDFDLEFKNHKEVKQFNESGFIKDSSGKIETYKRIYKTDSSYNFSLIDYTLRNKKDTTHWKGKYGLNGILKEIHKDKESYYYNYSKEELILVKKYVNDTLKGILSLINKEYERIYTATTFSDKSEPLSKTIMTLHYDKNSNKTIIDSIQLSNILYQRNNLDSILYKDYLIRLHNELDKSECYYFNRYNVKQKCKNFIKVQRNNENIINKIKINASIKILIDNGSYLSSPHLTGQTIIDLKFDSSNVYKGYSRVQVYGSIKNYRMFHVEEYHDASWNSKGTFSSDYEYIFKNKRRTRESSRSIPSKNDQYYLKHDFNGNWLLKQIETSFHREDLDSIFKSEFFIERTIEYR